MLRQLFRRLDTNPQSSRPGKRLRLRRRRWVSRMETLEERTLLSGNPTVYTVDLVSDVGTGSGPTGDLRYVIDQANANTNLDGSVIQFDPSVFSSSMPQSIVLTHTLDLTGKAGPIVINGPGSDAVVVSGNNGVTVFSINAGVTATLSGLTISSGRSSGNGGGVLNEGSLTLNDCFIADNTAVDSGGGIENDGSLTVSDCAVSENTAKASTGYGGGIDNSGSLTLVGSVIAGNEVSGGNGYGGGIANSGTLTVDSSQIYDNSVTDGDGGGIFNNATATISFSSIDDNTTGNSGSGGGIENLATLTVANSAVYSNVTGGYGGGIANGSDLDINDSTIADNTARSQGGGIDNSDTLTAVNVTIADNVVKNGGGGGGLYAGSTATTLDNTIVAQNTASSSSAPDDIAGTVSPSSAFNLIGTGGAGGLTNGAGGNQVGVANPGLGSLGQNGGPTETIALLPGSPAIGAGATTLDSSPTDQRGPGFIRIYNGRIDIGAYELQPAAVSAVSVDWGSSGIAPLQTAADGLRLLPAGRHTDLPWLGINELQITLNQPEMLTSGDVSIVGIRGIQYGPVTITGSDMSYTLSFARPIEKADRVTIAIEGAGLTTFIRRLDVLPGDFSDDGVVNSKDITAIRNEWKGAHGAQPTLFGEILGDGTVNASDYRAARKFDGARLPRLPKTGGKPAEAVLVRALARPHLDAKPRHHA